MSELDKSSEMAPVSEESSILSPLIVKDKNGNVGPAGLKYELDYNRESAAFLTKQGVDFAEENTSKRIENVPLMFFAAFRKNYKNRITREKTDKWLKENNGLSIKGVNYLYALLAQALFEGTMNTDEGDGKNGIAMDLEMDD